MKLLADESVDAPVVKILREAGFDIVYIFESDQGISDDRVLERSNPG